MARSQQGHYKTVVTSNEFHYFSRKDGYKRFCFVISGKPSEFKPCKPQPPSFQTRHLHFVPIISQSA